LEKRFRGCFRTALFVFLPADVKELPSRENLLWVGIGSGLALAAHPFDDDVNHTLVGNDTADNIFKAGEILGELGTLSEPRRQYMPWVVSETNRECHTSAWI